MRHSLVAPLAVLMASVLALPAQDGSGTPAPADIRDRIFVGRVDIVLAPTTVTDKAGSYVQGLKPSEFQLFDNDKLQDIRVDESYAPISLVVAIQADAKMEGVIPKIQKLGTMFENLIAGDQGEVAILSFDHRLQHLQDFTNDATKLQEALKKLRPGSSTSRLVDAVEESSRMLRNRPKERRRIILLISESRDKGSEGRIRETLTTTQVDNVMIYSLDVSRLLSEFTASTPLPRPDPIPAAARHQPAGAPVTPTTAMQATGGQGSSINFIPLFEEVFKSVKHVFVDNPVEYFTKYTGGREIPFLSQKSLENAAAEIGREIHNQYLISYNPNNKMEAGFHNIKVVVMRRGYDVRTRPGYWLAAVQ